MLESNHVKNFNRRELNFPSPPSFWWIIFEILSILLSNQTCWIILMIFNPSVKENSFPSFFCLISIRAHLFLQISQFHLSALSSPHLALKEFFLHAVLYTVRRKNLNVKINADWLSIFLLNSAELRECSERSTNSRIIQSSTNLNKETV